MTTDINVAGACALCLNIHPIGELTKVTTSLGKYEMCPECLALDNTFKCGICGAVHYKTGFMGIKPCKGGDDYGDICPTCDKLRREQLTDDEFVCDMCGNIHETSEDGVIHYGEEGELMACSDCVDAHFSECRDCGKYHLTAQMTYLSYVEEYVCDDCIDKYEECEECGEMFPADEMERDGNTYYCESCYEDEYTHCDCCGHIVRHDETHYHEHTDIVYCEDCWDENTFTCADCGDVHLNEDSHIVRDEHDNEVDVCDNCYENYYSCGDCGELYHYDNMEYDEEDGYHYCRDCSSKREVIKPYSHKPEPIFYGNINPTRNTRYMGVEIEIDNGGEDNSNAKEILNTVNTYSDKFIYAKHDGSLTEGFEMVSHPATLEHHMTVNYKELFRTAVRLGYRAHQTDTCGLHVHVNRDSLGDSYEERELTTMKILYLVEKHWDKIVKFSRRNEEELEQWANRYLTDSYTRQECLNNSYDGAKKLHDMAKDGCRYKAVNLNNNYTIEFRVFKGTLKYNSFIATLQFVDLLCNIAKESSVQKIVATSWDDIVESSKDKKELMQYYVERKLFTFADADGEDI